MLYLGVDIIILYVAAVLFAVVTAWFCSAACVSKEVGNAAVMSSLLTGMFMVLVYIIMAKVLDAIVM